MGPTPRPVPSTGSEAEMLADLEHRAAIACEACCSAGIDPADAIEIGSGVHVARAALDAHREISAAQRECYPL